MPALMPFRPYRYTTQGISDPGAVIAPPYDVISPERRQALLAGDPHNVIQLILPEGDESTRYTHAAELLQQWITEGVLVREDEPAIYPYAQTFTRPITGDRIERRGFIATIELSPFSDGKILPHERTLSGPKADRLQLMQATGANLEPIFGVYRDPYGTSSQRLQKAISSNDPIITATDSDGVEHRLWRLSDEDALNGFASDLAKNTVFIVDGHHRYETAINYQRIRREQNPETPYGAAFDYIMMFVAPTSDPGLVILPTHRVIHSLPEFDSDTLVEKLQPNFSISVPPSREIGLEELELQAGRPAFLLLSGERTVLAMLRDDTDLDQLLPVDMPDALKRLDVTLLHDFILQRLLGVTAEAQVEQRNIQYIKSTQEALEAASRPETQLVVLMNATRLEQVEHVAESGSVMPQKSTYFYPKLASGLLFNPLT